MNIYLSVVATLVVLFYATISYAQTPSIYDSCIKSKRPAKYCRCMADGIDDNQEVSASTKQRLAKKFTTNLNHATGSPGNTPSGSKEIGAVGLIYVQCLNQALSK